MQRAIRRAIRGNHATDGGKRKVFGVGLSRTATTSLASALDRLGYRTVHFPYDRQTQREIHEFFDSGAETIRLSVLNEFDAAADSPICCIYKALDRSYPESKFILTTRDKSSWLDSCERHWGRVTGPLTAASPDSNLTRYMNYIDTKLYGLPHFDRTVFARVYDEYHARVLDHFQDRPDQLLVLDICGGEGWDQLAPYLGVPVPDETFPFENKLGAGPWDESVEVVSIVTSNGDASDVHGEERIRAYLDAFQARDLVACLDFYAEDAVVTFRDRVEGHKAISEWHRDRFKAGVQFTTVNAVEAAGEMVTVSGSVTTKLLKRVRVNLRGKVIFHLDRDTGKITSMRMESGR